MSEFQMHKRPQISTDRPVVGKIQGQTKMTQKGSQQNVGHVAQKSFALSRHEKSGRWRVNENAGSVMASGNQVMLLRQKRIMKATTQSTHKSQVQKQQNQIQTIAQDNIGGISMLEGKKISVLNFVPH
jgi:hypothetical protein